MISKAGQVTIMSLLANKVFYMAEVLLTRKFTDTEITQDLEFIKEELGKSLANLTYFFIFS